MSRDTSSPAPDRRVVALAGNPNCGKTTIFNALTGLRQKVGNYPGVTVERKEGIAIGQHGEEIRLLDLPGAYSLNAKSPDEEILRDVLLGRRDDTPKPDVVICVVDASNPERHLYLATQILDLGMPAILVLNMIDVAEERGVRIDPDALARRLNVPVIPMRASRRQGLPELRIAMSLADPPPSTHRVPLPEEIDRLLEEVSETGSGVGHTGPPHAALYVPGRARERLDENQEWQSHLIAARYGAIRELCGDSFVATGAERQTLTDRLDRVFLHRVGGWLSLFAVLGLLFFLIFSVAGYPMDWIDSAFGALAGWVENAMPPGDLRDLITRGAIPGVGGVVIFLPQILILFFFIGLMEDTGYLSRVAFIMDRLMSRVGLHGRSFVPLLSSYACAVPGIMGTRTIDNPKDRLVTILVAPFASCSARMPVYLIMIATLVPDERVPVLTKSLALTGLYALGTAGIFAFAWLFNRLFKRGESSIHIMELPTYKAPALRTVLTHMWERSRLFVRRAGTVILGASILIWAAENYPKSGGDDPAIQLEQSVAGRLGKAIEPAIAPLGFDWRIGIGLVASFAAREVFVSTMSITYHVAEEAESDELRDRFREATRADGGPLFSPLTCVSLMVFYVFALQCVSTLAVVRRETNSWRWPAFQFAYMTLTAYLASLIVYQGGRWLGFG